LNAQETTTRRVVERSKIQTTNRVENRAEQGVEGAMNKIEEGIGNLFRRRDRNNRGSNEDANSSSDTGSQVAGGMYGDSESIARQRRAAYTKFDFVTGEKVLFYEDFERVEYGDFPIEWNTNAGGEVVSLGGTDSKWFIPNREGIFVPEMVELLPENFTLEFDLYVTSDFSNSSSGLKTVFVQQMDRMSFDQFFNTDPQVMVDVHPSGGGGGEVSFYTMNTSGQEVRNRQAFAGEDDTIYRISMWRQNTRLRVYVDENKVLDLPRAFSPGVDYTFLLAIYAFSGDLMFTDMKIAVGAPDTRSSLITEGKFVTNGITFDSGSDVLRPSSYGVIKEIAEALQQNPGVEVMVVGHTDSDGSESLNLDLSKRRALSVKNALVSDFGISAPRIQTDGKGQSEPLAPNTTSEGKAQNRRVEFLKLN
jgi:outer membrane protein OmpA-like peptidoglycan-associated protein